VFVAARRGKKNQDSRREVEGRTRKSELAVGETPEGRPPLLESRCAENPGKKRPSAREQNLASSIKNPFAEEKTGGEGQNTPSGRQRQTEKGGVAATVELRELKTA